MNRINHLGYSVLCLFPFVSFCYGGVQVLDGSELTPPASGGESGSAVAVGDGWIAVGAPLTDVGTSTNQGVVYIYNENPGGGYVFASMIKDDQGSSYDLFGQALSAKNNMLAVGVANDDRSGAEAGVVHLYETDGTNWSYCSEISSTQSAGDLFGCAVSFDGDRLAVGSRKYGVGGGVFVFDRTESGTWVTTEIIEHDDAASSDYFGCSVWLDGDSLAVGASDRDEQGSKSGTVYVYEYDPSSWPKWQQSAHLLASNGSSFDLFGKSVALCGDILAAGAPGAGEVLIYNRSSSNTWHQTTNFVMTGISTGDFGYSVAMNEMTLLVGAPGAIVDNQYYAGTVRIYELPAPGENWAEPLELVADDIIPNGAFGTAVSVPDIDVPMFTEIKLSGSDVTLEWNSGYTNLCWGTAGYPGCTNAGIQAGCTYAYEIPVAQVLESRSTLLEGEWMPVYTNRTPLAPHCMYTDNLNESSFFRLTVKPDLSEEVP